MDPQILWFAGVTAFALGALALLVATVGLIKTATYGWLWTHVPAHAQRASRVSSRRGLMARTAAISASFFIR